MRHPRSAAVRDGRRRVGVRWRCFLLLSFSALILSLVPRVATVYGHGGPPLRLGVTGDPDVAATGRLALVHLREGVGLAVDWREFPDETALHAAFAAGKIDVAVVAAGFAGAARPGADCAPDAQPRLREELRGRWGGEAYLLRFSPAAAPCLRPALVVSRAVLADLRFGILGREAERFAASVAPEDVAAVRAAGARGGERAATAAARAALSAKGGP
ncbi:MAG TPA: hypothetical protein VN317_07915 [Candidatus Methanoperedens sp.]|nr:hypothetical protein [Candidatus Methanoperedens sp.]